MLNPLSVDICHQDDRTHAGSGVLAGRFPAEVPIWLERRDSSWIHIWSNYIWYTGRSLWATENLWSGAGRYNRCLSGLRYRSLGGQQFHVSDRIPDLLESSQYPPSMYGTTPPMTGG